MRTTRRQALVALLGGASAGSASAVTTSAVAQVAGARSTEGRRVADCGDGNYLNPIVSGDHADPTILKDGDVYYMTFSSFDAYPAVVIWRSHDLLKWEPLEAALHADIGSIWAMDLVKHAGRYFIYIPAAGDDRQRVYVISSDRIEGPWSEPIDLHLDGCIDPGHAVGEDGRRWLFVNGVRRAPLSEDGLKVTGPLEHAYDAWRYPAGWVVEMAAPEGPKIVRRGECST